MQHFFSRLRGALLLLALPTAALAQTGVTIGASTAPDVSAALDIISTTKGALLPRVADATALATPAKGLLVYQTGGTPGFYYNAGTPAAPSWQQIATAAGAAITASNGLTKTGQDIALGGTLTGATAIAQAGFNLGLTGGNVGIGTASPATRLGVKGAGSAYPATSGTGQSAGHVARFGDASNLVLDLGGNGGNGVWLQATDATNLASNYSLLLNPNGGSVGIGLSSPTQPFEVMGTSAQTYVARISSPSTIGTRLTLANSSVGGQGWQLISTGSGNSEGAGGLLAIDGAGNLRTALDNTGRFGIGVVPTAKLDVSGSTRLRGLTTAGIVTTDASGNLSSTTAAALDPTTASNGLTKTGVNVALGGSLTTPTTIAQAGNNLVVTGGSVGIGTAAPQTTLDVSGDFRVSTGSVNSTLGTTGSGVVNFSGANLGQSFTLPVAASITSIRLVGSNTYSATFQIHSGSGSNGTALLPAPQAISFTAGASTTVVLPTPLSVAAGTYTLVVQATSGVRYFNSDNYAGGNIYQGAISSPGQDLDFTVAYTSGSATSAFAVNSGGNVGIGTSSTPAQRLDVTGGSIQISTTGQGYGLIFPDGTKQTTAAVTGTGANFIQNQTTQQATSNFNISGNGTVGGTTTTANAVVTTALTGSGANIGSVVGLGIRADGGLNIGQNTSSNLFVGYAAGRDNIINTGAGTGITNHFVGVQAGERNTTGAYNFMEGSGAGQLTTTGSSNLYMGWLAGQVGNGDRNFAIGMQAGRANTASDNHFVGFYAGTGTNTGSRNTFEGNYAGVNNTSGGRNTFVGFQAGADNNTGSNNFGFGHMAGPASGSGALTNAGAIGYNAKVSQDNSLVLGGTGTDAVKVGIGTTAPSQTLDVTGGSIKISTSGQGLIFPDATTQTTAATTSTASNGLTKTTNNIALGGSLTQATTILQAGSAFNLTGGNVGIGTATPQSTLDVNGDLRVSAGTTNATLGTTGSGNVTASNANLGQSFTMPTAGTVTSIRLRSNATYSTTFTLYSGGGTSGTALATQGINFTAGTATTVPLTTPLALAAGTYTLTLTTGTSILYHNTGTDTYTGGTLYFGNSAGGGNVDLEFTVAYTSGTSTSAFYVGTGGNVGIGTSGTPAQKLEVTGGSIKISTAGQGLIFPDNTTQTTAATAGSFIQNQTASAQTGGFNLSGNGTVGGSLTAGSLTAGSAKISNLTTVGLVRTDASGNLSSSASGVANGLFWGLGGNSGTSPGTHFIGTTDAQDVVFKVGGTERMRLKQNGALSLLVGGAGGNTFVGENTGQNVVVASAYNNTFLGTGAGMFSTTGNGNTYVGTVAGWHATTGSTNTAVGTAAGSAISQGGSGGNGNSLLGYNAGTAIDAGVDNTLMGTNSGRSIVGNSGNAFFGAGTGELSTGTNNTFIGNSTGGAMLSGNQNVFLGAFAGRWELGTGNTLLGFGAGPAGGAAAGTNNTLLGNNTTIGSGLSNATAIGNGASVTVSNALVLGSSVNVGIGTAAPAKRLHVDAGNDVLRVDNLAQVSATNNYLVIDNSGNVGKTTVENVAGQVIRLGFNGGNYFENTTTPAAAESALRFNNNATAANMGTAPNGAANFINTVTGSSIATGQVVAAGNGTNSRTTDQITLPAGVYRVTVRLSGSYFVGSASGTVRSGFVKFIVNNNEYSLVETLNAYDNGVTTHSEVSDYLNLSSTSTVDFSVRFLRNFTLIDRLSPGTGNSYRSLLLIERVR